MEYRSPLGYNFKLEKSLSASREEKSKEPPQKGEFVQLDTLGSKQFFNSDSRRNSGNDKNYSPAWRRRSSNWKSPNPKNFDEPVPVEHYYHPSMLENPWAELENDLKTS